MNECSEKILWALSWGQIHRNKAETAQQQQQRNTGNKHKTQTHSIVSVQMVHICQRTRWWTNTGHVSRDKNKTKKEQQQQRKGVIVTLSLITENFHSQKKKTVSYGIILSQSLVLLPRD